MTTRRTWLVSDNYGGADPSYDRIMGHRVEGSSRISEISSRFQDSQWDLVYWYETRSFWPILDEPGTLAWLLERAA